MIVHSIAYARLGSALSCLLTYVHQTDSLLRIEQSTRRALYIAHPWLLWTSVLADALVTICYALFFLGIASLAKKLKHIPEVAGTHWIFIAFRLFFVCSGLISLLRVVSIWLPTLRLVLTFKVLCAVASMPAGILFAWRASLLADHVIDFFNLHLAEREQGKALRKSEQLLDRTNRVAGVGGWEIDLATRAVSWSEETYRIHGAPFSYRPTLEEAITFYTAESRPVIAAAVEAACVAGGSFDLELSIIRIDGRLVWVRVFGTAELLEGAPVRLVGAFQDVTARRAEREALKEANERAVLAAESGRIGLWDWDIPRGVVSCDRWMHRLHGVEFREGPADEQLWRQRLHPEDRNAVIEAMGDAIAGTRPYEIEFRVVWPDGSIHNIRATAQVKRDRDGRALRMVGANWDVTEARRLTAELAQQHELLRITMQSIGDGVITTDTDAKVVWLNPVAERMICCAAAEAVGRPLTEIFPIVHSETREPVENPIVNCLAYRKVATLASHTVLVGRDGSEYGIEDSAAPILGANGELLGGVLVFYDVTEQRRLAQEASRGARLELKLKNDFLSHVSHELRSPLTSIYSFCSILADGLAGETTTEQRDYLRIILRNTDQLQSMIEDLLLVTQGSQGKVRINVEPISVREAVKDAVHTVEGAAQSKHIALSSDCGTRPLSVCADPTRLRQILIILLDNAVKFTPAHGRVAVRVSAEDSEFLLFEVMDNGCGIPADKKTRVFENLYQIIDPETTTANHNGRNGLGLGLHIAKDLVEGQQGHIWVNDGPDNGSTFCFTLPVAAIASLPQAVLANA